VRHVCNGGGGGVEVVPLRVSMHNNKILLYNRFTHPRAISRLLMSFLIFHISTLRSEVVSSPLVVISDECEEYNERTTTRETEKTHTRRTDWRATLRQQFFCGFLPLSATRAVTTGRQCNNGIIQSNILYTVLLNILSFKFVQLKCVTRRSRLGRREEHSRSRTHTDKTSHAHARTAER